MDVTMAPTGILGRMEPASSLSKTVVGGGMDITMDPITGDHTRHGGGMETTLVSSNQVDHLPDSLPNSNNSSFDGGATATVKFSQLALANNTLVLPRYTQTFNLILSIIVDIAHCTGGRVRKMRRKILPGHLSRSFFVLVFDQS